MKLSLPDVTQPSFIVNIINISKTKYAAKKKEKKKRRKEMIYLILHSTHFIYGYMMLDIR